VPELRQLRAFVERVLDLALARAPA